MHTFCVSVNRPIFLKRGWPGEVETNQTNAFFGEWAVFKLPLESGAFAELRMPLEDAVEEGLVDDTDNIELTDEDYLTDEEEEANGH